MFFGYRVYSIMPGVWTITISVNYSDDLLHHNFYCAFLVKFSCVIICRFLFGSSPSYVSNITKQVSRLIIRKHRSNLCQIRFLNLKILLGLLNKHSSEANQHNN